MSFSLIRSQCRRVRLGATLLAAAVLVLSACHEQASPEASRQVDAAVDKTEKAAAVAANKAGELADTARDKTRAYLTSPEVKQHLESAKEAVHEATEPARN